MFGSRRHSFKGHDVRHPVLHSSDFTVNILGGESEKYFLIV